VSGGRRSSNVEKLRIDIPLVAVVAFVKLPREFRPVDLARLSGMNKNTAQKLCQRLERYGLISKKSRMYYVKLYDSVSEFLAKKLREIRRLERGEVQVPRASAQKEGKQEV